MQFARTARPVSLSNASSFSRFELERAELLDGVWHSGASQSPSTVTEHVRRIRLKLQTRLQMPPWLVTVRGTGYRFNP